MKDERWSGTEPSGYWDCQTTGQDASPAVSKPEINPTVRYVCHLLLYTENKRMLVCGQNQLVLQDGKSWKPMKAGVKGKNYRNGWVEAHVC